MPYFEIELPLEGLDADGVEAALTEAGAIAISLLDRGDEPILEPLPGEMRLWGDTLVRALFDAALDPADCLLRIAARLGPRAAAGAKLRAVPERVWERAWLDDWKPMRFGAHLWVCPTTADPPADAAAVVLRLDPGLAFGTGTHPTTALCLERLSALDLRGRTVLDYGCGSGILAIAALKLGASSACCVDLDPQALTASRANAETNGVSARLTTLAAGGEPGRFDVVCANILAGTLVELAARIGGACKAGGELLLSGILDTQTGPVIAAYRPRFDVLSMEQRDDWCCIHLHRRAGVRGES